MTAPARAAEITVPAVRDLLTRCGLAVPDAVVQLTTATGGASRHTIVIDVESPGLAAQRVVLRAGADAASNTYPLLVEGQLLQAALAAGVPVPRLLAAGDDTGGLGMPFLLLEYVAGETLPKRLRTWPEFTRARQLLARQLGTALGRLHLVSLELVPAEVAAVGDPVAACRDELDLTGQPHPAFEIGLRWLEAHRPPARSAVLTHGDYRLGNLIIGPDGLRAVLDWELSAVADPRLDLGWLCSPSWRFGGQAPVGGIGEYDDLLQAYAEVTGVVVTVAELRWFEVLAVVRWGVLCIRQTTRHLTGSTRSIELAALGRRVCEMEWALMEMLSGARQP